MKINVAVDLSDFYSSDDEASFESEIKDYIVRQVRNEVIESWKDRINKEIVNLLNKQIEGERELIINQLIHHIFTQDKIQKSHNGKEMVTTEEYVREVIGQYYNVNSNLNSQLRQMLEAESKSITAEFQKRYDIMFASKIITRLNENGFLKDEVAKMLLESN